MTFEELVRDFAKRVELEDFSADENGTCHLVSDEAVINIQNCPEVKKILLVAPVAPMPPETDSAILRRCLAANFMYYETCGGTLSLDSEHEMLTLTRYMDIDVLNDQDFYDAIILFATALAKWQREFNEMVSGEAAAEDENGAAESDMSGHSVFLRI